MGIILDESGADLLDEAGYEILDEAGLPPFPQSPLDLQVELDLAGAWTAITSYAYQRDGTSPPVKISRGRANEQASATPTSLDMEWNNRDGRFSPRNPTGPYYGSLGRNTPVRVSVPASGTYLRIADDAVSYASCPGSAGLTLSADIDVRVDMTLDNWAPCFLAGQWNSGNKCWALSLNGDGTLMFTWNDGTNVNQVSSTLPAPLGRVAVRAYFDPAGTSGSPQVIFYTAATMASSFVQLGNPVAITAADYAHSASTPTAVGYSTQWASDYGQGGLQGSVYEVRVYSGATLEADPVFTAQTAGTTSFSDLQGNTWTLSGTAQVSGRNYRAHAECTTLPQRWDPSGADVWTPVSARGVLRRIQQGNSPLPSSMRRFVSSSAAAGYWTQVLGYWPGEDNAGATSVASGLPGGLAMSIGGTPAFQGQAGSKSADTNFACSAQLGQVQGSSWAASVPAVSAPGTLACLLYIPSGTPSATLLNLWPLSLSYSTASSGTLSLTMGGGAGGAVTGPSGINGTPLLVFMYAQSGTTTGQGVLTVIPLNAPQNLTQVVTSSAGYVVPGFSGSVQVNPSAAALGSLAIGHILAVTGTYTGPSSSPYGAPSSYAPSTIAASVPSVAMMNAAFAHQGETAGNRVLRLLAENSIAGRVYGYPNLTMAMGAQGVDTLANLLQYCEDSDRGQLYEPAEALGVGYRTLGSLCSQAAAVTLDYSQAELGDGSQGLEPEDDDQYTVNDATVARSGGSSAQVQVTTGTMSISAPPNGVGDYDTQITTYNAWDKDLPGIAGWIAHVGTTDQERYPVIPLSLARTELTALLQEEITGLRLGDFAEIINMPAWMPPGAVKQLIYGYSENLGGFHWDIGWNAAPETPYETAIAGTALAESGGTTLASSYSSSATSLSVNVTGTLWATGSGLSIPVMVSGEGMTITAISGGSSPQAFTVTRSTNGVVKAQSSGAAVTLAAEPVAALAGNH